jgi:hypothetical protein
MVRGTLDVVLMGVLTLGLVALTGCEGIHTGGTLLAGGPAPTGALAAGGAKNIYAVQTNGDESNESILEFSLGGSGSVTPTSTLLPPPSLVVGSVATDSTGQIYVGGNLNPGYVILVYAAGSSGAATPVRTITLGEFYPISMTVDASGKLYVAGGVTENTNGGVAVFAADAHGAATPLQMITNADLLEPLSMTVDTAGQIYLSGLTATNGEILVFAAGATGSATPIHTISAPASSSTQIVSFWGLAVDSQGSLYAVQDTETMAYYGGPTSVSSEIQKYLAEEIGNAAPAMTISGSMTGLGFGGGLRLDSAGNLYLANETLSGTTSTYNLLGFGPNASGNVAPGLELSSSLLTSPAPEVAVQ